jgi:hypothetical protein
MISSCCDAICIIFANLEKIVIAAKVEIWKAYICNVLVRSLLGRLCEEPRFGGINSATKQSRFFKVSATARLLRHARNDGF